MGDKLPRSEQDRDRNASCMEPIRGNRAARDDEGSVWCEDSFVSAAVVSEDLQKKKI